MRTAKTLSISIPQTLGEALELARRDAERKGLNKLTMREINQEIAAYRREVQAGEQTETI